MPEKKHIDANDNGDQYRDVNHDRHVFRHFGHLYRGFESVLPRFCVILLHKPLECQRSESGLGRRVDCGDA